MNYLEIFHNACPMGSEESFILGLETREPEVQGLLKVIESLMLSDFLPKKELLEATNDLKLLQEQFKTSINFLKEELKYSE